MAKKVLVEQYYTFNPTSRTITIPRAIPKESMVLIVNVDQNKVIYNFSDPNLTATSYVVTATATTITLNYNTTTMSSTDNLQFTYDEQWQDVIPAEQSRDPAFKQKVSAATSLIDTDFEYGAKAEKWENLSLLNGRPSFYYDTTAPGVISDVLATNGSKTITIYAPYAAGTGTIVTSTSSATVTGTSTAFTTQFLIGNALYSTSDVLIGTIVSIESDTSLTLEANAAVTIASTSAFRYAQQAMPSAGSPFQIQDTAFTPANGGYLLETSTPNVGSSRWEFTYTCSANFTGTTGSIYIAGSTTVYSGSFYTGAGITISAVASVSSVAAGSTANDVVLILTSARNHGLTVGNLIYLTGAATVATGTQPGNKSYIVNAVYSPTKFSVIMPAGTTMQTFTNAGTLVAYPRHEAVITHRPIDGGVKITPNSQSHNYQTIRQTRKYFRYQSGKGTWFAVGAVMKPDFNIDSLTASSTTITCVTKEPHNFYPGASVKIINATEPGLTTSAYNGTFTVVTVADEFTFTYTALTVPTSTTAYGFPQVSLANWSGGSVRLGLGDQQQGAFFEYDGSTMYVVKRTSARQLSGLVSVTNGSDQIQSVTTLGAAKQTKFLKQLVPGEWVVIRGQSYRVMEVINDQRIRVNPEYRGVTQAVATISKTIDIKVPQSQWNMDRLDGTGPSGITLDPNKIQLYHMDFAWQGAGAIRFGIKDQNGNPIYCHKISHSNNVTEAYWRSGNLPIRYDANTVTPYTQLSANFAAGATTLTVASTDGFPSSGMLLIANPGKDSTDTALAVGGPTGSDCYEYVMYSSKTATTFNITARSAGLAMNGTGVGGYRTDYFYTSAGTVTTVSGSPVVTTSKPFLVGTVGNAINMAPIGSFVTGTNIPENTYIVGYDSTTNQIKLSSAATGSGAITNFTVYAMSSNANGATNSGVSHTYTLNGPVIPVYLHTNQFSPVLNHWGTAINIDGGFDYDKQAQYSAANPVYNNVYTTQQNALLSLRLAPAADNGTPGLMGAKELINRIQLKLRSLGVTTNGSMYITVVLNPKFASNAPTFQNYGDSSVTQVALHPAGTTVSGGDILFGFHTNQAGGTTNFTTTEVSLENVRELGNAALGGGTSNTLTLNSNASVFPDGPDVVTIVAENAQLPVAIIPTTVTSGSPVVTLSDVTGFQPGWVVTANGGGGVPVGSVINSITPQVAGNFLVSFTKNATSAVVGSLTISPPGSVAAKITWSEA